MRNSETRNRLANLDLLRGLAALAVCAGHLRAFLFVDYGQITQPNLFDRAFYFATGLGHQAVVVFFVLSGYLVGGSVLTAHQKGRWSWGNYALRRMTRLWMVLLPALILTLGLDSLGRHLNPAGYNGAYHAMFNSGPTPGVPADLSFTTLLGNVFFLQTISVNCYGTNGPLWSLANEFWYYVLFPLLVATIAPLLAILRPRNPAFSFQRFISSAFLVAILVWWLPGNMLWSGLIWLFGVAAFWSGRSEKICRVCRHPAWILGFGILLLGTLAASKTGSVLGTDWSIGITFALWIIGLAQISHQLSTINKLASGLSDMSYTLYLVHFPLLAFVFFFFVGKRQLQPGFSGYLGFSGLLLASIASAAGIWFCFERNTDRVRKQIERMLVRRVLPQTETA